MGSAIDLHKRKQHHLYSLRKNSHENPRLQNHFNKYGEDDLLFFVVEYCTKDNLILREQFYLDSLRPYFNICLIAGSSLGRKHSKEAKQKVSEANSGRKHTDESKKHMKDGRKVWAHSPETKRKMSEAAKGKPKSEEGKRKMRLAKLGKTMSIESSRKKSEAMKGRLHSPEHNSKVSIAITEWWRKRKEQKN